MRIRDDEKFISMRDQFWTHLQLFGFALITKREQEFMRVFVAERKTAADARRKDPKRLPA